jgi:uncharacterized protein YkwD
MKLRIITLAVTLFVVLLSVSCSSGVSQAEYDALKSQLADTRAQLDALKSAPPPPAGKDPADQAKITSLEAAKQQLEQRVSALTSEKVALETSAAGLTARLNDLDAKYAELKNQYDILSRPVPPEVLDPPKVEQAIFQSLNRDRVAAGLAEFTWGHNMYPIAQANSRKMAEFDRFEYPLWGTVQYLYIASGYSKLDSIVTGVMLTWKSNTFNYQKNILSAVNTHAAIGVHKVGEVFYITMMAANYA